MKELMMLLAALAALSGSGALLSSGNGLACLMGSPARGQAARDQAIGSPAREVGRPEGLARDLWRQRLADSTCR